MTKAPAHIKWLIDTCHRKASVDGKIIEIWRLQHKNDDSVLSEWASHFRQHYCKDEDLPAIVAGTGKTNAQYFSEIKFPDKNNAPGPSVRAGDFAEILVADYIEYRLGYWSPRARYQDKFNRNDSTKGSDTVGFKFASEQPGHPNDELFILETKAALTATAKNRLQSAVDDSKKDVLREAISLNALKQRLMRDSSPTDQSLRVQRFQDEVARPFRRIHGAAAVLSDTVYQAAEIDKVDASKHPNVANLILIVITGEDLMTLVHTLYQRAADEA